MQPSSLESCLGSRAWDVFCHIRSLCPSHFRGSHVAQGPLYLLHAEDTPGLLIQSLFPLCWDDRHMSLCSVLFMLGMAFRAHACWAGILPTELQPHPL